MFSKKIAILILFVLVLYYLNKQNYEHFYNRPSYKRCSKIIMNPLTKKIFTNHQILQNNQNWQIYIPCGYNNIADELKTLHGNKNKYIFGIDGCDKIISKNNMWNILLNYYGFDTALKLCPNTYINNNYDNIRLKNDFKQDKVYILKKNIQSQKGLYITKNLQDIYDKLNNGYVVAQEMLNNPFTINEKKINIRAYILVVCHQNSKKIYYHENGIIYYTPLPYKKNSLEFDRNITSGYKFENNQNPIDLNELYSWMNKQGLNAYKFRNNMHTLLYRVFLALKDNICNDKYLKDNKTFQLFGVDLAPDNKLNFKIIEINKGPNMKIVDDNYDKEIKGKLMHDVFSLVDIIQTNDKNGFVKIW